MSPGQREAGLLLEGWTGLLGFPAGDRLFRSRRLDGAGALAFHLAVRSPDDAPCLLAAPGDAIADAVQTFETGGLRLSRAAGQAGPMLVLSLEEPDRRDLFALICADVIDAASEGSDERHALTMLAGRLAAWRAFLRDRSGRLGRADMVGIMGELLVLDRVVEAGGAGLAAWRAPDDGLHDFACGSWAVEVKTSLSGGRSIRVSSLDQLDDAGLASLYLCHVRLVEDETGDDLAALVLAVEGRLPDDRSRRDFRNALLRRGLLAEDLATPTPTVRVLSIDAYRVSEGFPRLLRVQAAPGIVDASYEVEVRALAPFAVDPGALAAVFQGTADV